MSRTAPAAGDGLSIPAKAAVFAVALAGCAVVVRGLIEANFNEMLALIALTMMAMAAERFDFDLYVDSRVSLAFVPIFAACLIAGTTGLALVATAAVAASAIGVSVPWYKTAFNFGALLLAGSASVWVLQGSGSVSDVSALPEVLIPVLLAAGANFLINAGLITGIICLTSSATPVSVWKEHFAWLWPHYLVLGILGLAIAAAHHALGLWGIGVFVVPPLMMRLSLKQYLDKTTEGVLELRQAHGNLQTAHTQLTAAMSNLDKAYDGTLRSLVAALDARDSETGGHSSRVADLTSAMAEEMGIAPDSEEGRIIAWGALLHDVGKIAVPDAILRKPGKLTDEEWVTMRTHARAGFEIVQAVEFLAPASQIILAHHERWDGAGYPRGLAAEEIPLGARIFMIADTFDAITSVRPYKPAIPAEEALAEILRHSGTQFDPTAVKAFLSVYQKRFIGVANSRGTKRPLSVSVRRALSDAAALMEKKS